MNKEKRQAILIDLIKKKRIASHQGLIEALKKQGLDIGQATISRDIRELGIVKKNNAYWIEGSTNHEEIWQRTFREKIKAVEQAGTHILVVKGILGSAPTISVEVEAMNWPEIAGVIAGDDTLFFAFRNEKDLKKIKKRFLNIIS